MRLCSQIGYLSVPNFQPVVCVPDAVEAMDLETISRSGSSNSDKAESAHIGWNYLGLGLSSTAPPKRFYTTFWQSISLRLLSLEQGPCEGSMPSRAGLHPTPEVD